MLGSVDWPKLKRLSWYFTRAMVASDAITLFFQVMGVRVGARSRPSRQANGKEGFKAKAVAIPTKETPAWMTPSATALRRMPPVTISGIFAMAIMFWANSRK